MPVDRVVYRFIVTETKRMTAEIIAEYQLGSELARGPFQELLIAPFRSALTDVLPGGGPVYDQILNSFTIRPLPSASWRLVVGGQYYEQPTVDQFVIPYLFEVPPDFDAVKPLIMQFATAVRGISGLGFLDDASDVPIAPSDHWCPVMGGGATFGTRDDADAVIRLGALGSKAKRANLGTGVNIVLVDAATTVDPVGTLANGWKFDIGTGMFGGSVSIPIGKHTAMMIRNIQDVAPAVNIFLVPLLPENIVDLKTFLSTAKAAYVAIFEDIDTNAALPPGTAAFPPGKWILVNPWNLYDRRLDVASPKYWDDPTHPFTARIFKAANSGGYDVVFSAGNCGQFCPDQRCGPNDIGPGGSIGGANSRAIVVTVGAVRADETWLGYSSQGPGQTNLGLDKPDFCAPSHFSETDDAAMLNVGTSAACAITAGVMAALRGAPSPSTLSPDALRKLLCDFARPVPGLPADTDLVHRLGHGIIDIAAAWSNAGKPPLP